MQKKKRPKYITELVNKVNICLKTLGKQGENSHLHVFITSYLIQKICMKDGTSIKTNA